MRRFLVPLVALLTFLAATGALAQTEEEEPPAPPPNQLSVLTPYPAVAVEPGDQVTFDLTVSSPDQAEVNLGVEGVPEGWNASFQGGGFQLDSVMAGPQTPAEVEFNVSVPAEAAEETVTMTVTADSGNDSTQLELRLRVSAAAGGEVTMSPDFPALRAATGETATFDVSVRNDTPADLQFELNASGPDGWQINAQPSGEEQASTLTVEAGSESSIQVEATPPPQAEAGQYPITVEAISPETTVSTELVVEVVGSFSMNLTTSDERLNAEVTVGSSTELPLLVVNNGTAPLRGVTMSATPPSGWEVTFDREELEPIPAGETAVVTASITPSEQAVAGDYVINFSAEGEETSGEIEVRTTVTPSAVWGILGIALIVLTLAALAWVFRRFGRR